MSLLKEFTGIPTYQKPDLKKSDSTDAGAGDVSGKMKPNDIGFSLMRNTINSDGEITGSDVADYLERAAELNDEIDTVPFGLETDDGDIVKVYVNAEQADKFEEAMKKLLGVEDDIEEAINKLAQEFDIIDVVWPKDKDEDSDELDLDAGGEFDALSDDDEMEVVGEFDDLSKHITERQMNDEGQDDPKAPTPEEAAAYSNLMNVIMNLSGMSPSGVEAATGFDHKELTKLEMIKKYVNEKHEVQCELARTWMKRVGDALDHDDVLPYWLREHIESNATNTQGEENMSIGSKFLARLSEGKVPVKGYKFDAATEMMKGRLRDIGGEKNFADKIAEVAAMSGMQGRFMNTPEGRASVLEGAVKLKARPAATAAFLALHSALSTFHGYMAEEKSEEDELDGVAFQQLVEEVLVELGIPQALVSEGGKAGAKASVKRTIAKIMQDANAKVAYQFLAKKLGIKVNDKVVGTKKMGQKVSEDVTKGTVGTDDTEKPNPQMTIKTANQNSLAGHAIEMIVALELPLNPGFVRNLNKPTEQRELNDLIRKNAALKRAVLAFANASK